MTGKQVLLGSKYWGPIGIQLGIGNQEICYNTIKDFWVRKGHAWGGDGGAIEMDDGRFHKDNVYIHHNRTINNCGFLEISWFYQVKNPQQVYFTKSAAGNGAPKLLKFAPSGKSDYHLSKDSHLRGKGKNLADVYATDFDGKKLPTKGPWDVGALQYQKAKAKP